MAVASGTIVLSSVGILIFIYFLQDPVGNKFFFTIDYGKPHAGLMPAKNWISLFFIIYIILQVWSEGTIWGQSKWWGVFWTLIAWILLLLAPWNRD